MRLKSSGFLQKLTKRESGYVFAIISSAMYGSIAPISKPIIQDVEPIMIASLVGLISAGVFALPAIKVKDTITKSSWALIGLVSVLGAILAPVFYFYGLKTTSATNGTILSNAEIIFTVILALFIFKEKIGRYGILSIALVLSGVYLVTSNFSNPLEFDLSKIGDVLILCTMFFWALDNNISKIVLKRVSTRSLVFLRSLIGGLILIPIAFLIESKVPLESLQNIILLSLVGFTIPTFMFYIAIKKIGTVKTILIFSSSPIFGIIFANLFLGEQIDPLRLLAVPIMLLGMILLYFDRVKLSTDINVQGPK